MQITVSHLIYTRVQPEYSPNRKNGFQIVYVSPDIIKDDQDVIEQRIQCFVPSTLHVEQNIAEYQYFWVPSGAAVVVQTVPIERDPVVIDSAPGRTGHFVSHALVISAQQFSRLANDPFAVIDSALSAGTFTDSVETLVAYLRETPPAKQIIMTRRKAFRESVEEWPLEHIENWARLAQTAEELISKKRSLLLLSKNPDTIYALLSLALYLMDRNLRIQCTFNTYVDGCVPAAGAYWSVGAQTRVSGSAFTTVNTDTYAIEFRQATDPKASPYLLWLRHALQDYASFSEGMSEIYIAQIAAESLADKQALPNEPLAEAVLTTFREANLAQYNAGVLTGLTTLVGKSAAEKIFPNLWDMVDIQTAMNAGAKGIFEPVSLARSFYEWIIANHTSVKDWRAILRFAQMAAHVPLILVAAAKVPTNPLNRNKYTSIRIKALEQLAQTGQLLDYLSDLQPFFKTEQLITPTTVALVAPTIDLQTLDDKAFVDFVAAIIKHDVSALDSAHTERVRKMTESRQIKRLTKLAKTIDTASEFVAAVQEIQ